MLLYKIYKGKLGAGAPSFGLLEVLQNLDISEGESELGISLTYYKGICV